MLRRPERPRALASARLNGIQNPEGGKGHVRSLAMRTIRRTPLACVNTEGKSIADPAPHATAHNLARLKAPAAMALSQIASEERRAAQVPLPRGTAHLREFLSPQLRSPNLQSLGGAWTKSSWNFAARAIVLLERQDAGAGHHRGCGTDSAHAVDQCLAWRWNRGNTIGATI